MYTDISLPDVVVTDHVTPNERELVPAISPNDQQATTNDQASRVENQSADCETSDVMEDERFRQKGYGNPPPEHRFKPGVSGNIYGRRKGSKNKPPRLNKMFKALAEREYNVDVDGENISATFIEALGLKMYEKAYAGQGNDKLAMWVFENTRIIEAAEDAEAKRHKFREVPGTSGLFKMVS